MGLIPRINTPSNQTRRLYIVAASGVTAAIAIASIVFVSLFYRQYHDSFGYNEIPIIHLACDCVIFVSFIIQVIFFSCVKKISEKGAFVLIMMLITEVLVLVNWGSSVALATKYNADKDTITDQNLREEWNNLCIVSLCLWCIAFVIFIWVTATYARMYRCG